MSIRRCFALSAFPTDHKVVCGMITQENPMEGDRSGNERSGK